MRCDFWVHVKRSLNECEPWILVQICMRWESPWESMVYNVACHVVISFVQRIKPSISLKYWAASSGVESRTSRKSLAWWSSLTDKFGDEHINQIWFWLILVDTPVGKSSTFSMFRAHWVPVWICMYGLWWSCSHGPKKLSGTWFCLVSLYHHWYHHHPCQKLMNNVALVICYSSLLNIRSIYSWFTY